MGLISRASAALERLFEKRPSGAVRAESFAFPLATRTWQDLTPEQAQAALQSAEIGSIRLACDFCDALLTDDRIAGILDTRTLGMLGLPLYFEGAELAEWYDLAPEGELARVLAWGLLLGVGFAHIEADGSLRWWHPRNFDFDRCSGDWYVNTSQGREKISRCMGDWLVFEPYGAFDSVLAGLWVSLMLPLLVKIFSLHDRARASEVFGSAMIVGKASEGATEPQRKQWLADLRSLSRSARVVLPEGYDLNLLEAQGQTWGIYQQSIEWADNAITIRIAGQLVTTTGAGAFSRGDVHEKIARSLLRFGEATFSTCLAKEYVPFVWANGSIPRWQTASPDDLIGEGTALKAFAEGATAVNALLADEPVELDLPAYLQRFGVLTRAKSVALPASQPLRLVAATSVLSRAGQQRVIGRATAIPADVPTSFRIFKMGANVTDYGTTYYTAESARLIITKMGNRDVMIDLEHNSLDKESRAYDPDARGSCRLQARSDGLWAVNVRWTADGVRRIKARLQRGISPVWFSRTKDGVITELYNLALTALPATHDGVILIASARGSMGTLREMLGLPPEATIGDILKALGIEASATAEDVLNAMAKAIEASDGEPAEDPPVDEDAAAQDAPAVPPKEVTQTTKTTFAQKQRDPVLARLEALEKRDENRERATLIASRSFKPWEKNMLNETSIETVRQYVANAPNPETKLPVRQETAADSAALDAVAKATGMTKTAVSTAMAKKGA